MLIQSDGQQATLSAKGSHLSMSMRDALRLRRSAAQSGRLTDSVSSIMRRTGQQLCVSLGPMSIPVLGTRRGLGRISIPIASLIIRKGA